MGVLKSLIASVEVVDILDGGYMPFFVGCSLINPTFIGFEETSSYWSVQ